MANLIPKDQYTVERSWFQEGDSYFPHITVTVTRDDRKTNRLFRVLHDRGEFRRADAARDAADAVQVEAVYDNDVITFVPPAW